MVRYVFRSERLYYLAADPALAERTAAFYRRNRSAFAPFDPVQPEEFFTAEGQRERLEWDMGPGGGGALLPLPAGAAPAAGEDRGSGGAQ